MPFILGDEGSGGSASAPLVLQQADAADPEPLRVIAASGATGDVLTVEDDAGAKLLEIQVGGYTQFQASSGPLDFLLLDSAGTSFLEYLRSAGLMVYLSSRRIGGITKDGALLTAMNSAPADGELSAGECALWLDQTDGAAKLMVKAKQADGTVRTAAVALA